MSAIIQAGPLENFSQERLPTGDSCVLVIFGASGDLTKRKLIPGLYNLSVANYQNQAAIGVWYEPRQCFCHQ